MTINTQLQDVGAVIIGRNEGERLVTCMRSLKNQIEHIVYVDSGSTDNSLAHAKELGIQTVELDLSVPFTAARARNEGAEALLTANSDLSYIQFVDGDCEVQADWIEKAKSFLEQADEYAIVCGRRRERYPDNSVFNALCDIEWNTPVGEAQACGGDALIRTTAFKQVDGYNPELIAGEEPEMCFRLRRNKWKIYRLDAEMTLHDAAMTKLSQWWKRAERAGYAYTNGFDLHGKSEEQFKRKEVISIAFWAGVLPLVVILFSFIKPWTLLLLGVYPLQIMRVAIRDVSKQLRESKDSWLYAASSIFAKFPQFLGLLRFYLNKAKGQAASIIEYK